MLLGLIRGIWIKVFEMTEYGDIYLIRSKGDGIPYVGVTKRFYQRKYAHFSMINRRKHHSKKINSYCKENQKTASDFEIFIIEKSIPVKTLYQKEKYWINFYDSIENGFNAKNGNYYPYRLFGENHPHTKLTDVAFRNIIDLYLTGNHTIKQISKIFDISLSSVNRVLHGNNRQHLVTKDELEQIRQIANKRHGNHNKHVGHKVIWNGVEYKNKLECANSTGINYVSLCRRINSGQNSDDDMKRKDFIVSYNDKIYKSLASCARDNNLTRQASRKMLKQGVIKIAS